MNAGLVMAMPIIPVHEEDGVVWCSCPDCPGWSAAAASWDELFRLVSEWHNLPEAPHRGWTMLPAWGLTFNA